jgi:hypothetical protein
MLILLNAISIVVCVRCRLEGTSKINDGDVWSVLCRATDEADDDDDDDDKTDPDEETECEEATEEEHEGNDEGLIEDEGGERSLWGLLDNRQRGRPHTQPVGVSGLDVRHQSVCG